MKKKVIQGLETISRIETIWSIGNTVASGGQCQQGVREIRKLLEELLKDKCKCKK